MTLRPLISFLCVSILTIAASAQQKQPEPAGSISGRITVLGKPAANIRVLLWTPGGPQRSVASAKTDAEGEFTLSNLSAGRYILHPFAPALVGPSTETTVPLAITRS